MHSDQLRALWLSVKDVAGPIADLRDSFLRFSGVNRRFNQYDTAYRNLLEAETALFEFLEARKPLLGHKPEREFLMVARAAIDNAHILLEIGESEFQLHEEAQAKLDAQD